ncbi:unnamed protein product [Schistosoma mattheei]|uniref:Uncharacterized protein n=1 Tax=Schistosoma mattheei TaxID=31246 RepID=A0AA85BG29_9TREM|nr:unnamed protein product [Schistosoma mattheei]
MYAIILLYALYFITNGKFEHVSARIVKSDKLSDSSASKMHTLKIMTDPNIHIPQKSNNRTSCNGTDKCELQKSSKNVSITTTNLPQTQVHNSTVVPHVPTTTHQKISQNHTIAHGTKATTAAPIPHVPTTTHQKISQNHTIAHGTKATTAAPIAHGTKATTAAPKSFLKKVGDGFFDLFSEQEFHPINQKSYLFNFWYLFRSSFLNLKNMKTLLLGS